MAEDFQLLQSQIQAALVATTRTAGQIAAEDLSFQRSLNPEVGAALDEQSSRLLTVTKNLLKSAASVADLRAPDVEDADDVETSWSLIVDIVDSLLEKADTCLDEYTGLIKQNHQTAAEQTSSKVKTSQTGNAFRNRNIEKPQLSFEHPPDNQDTSPWKPLLTSKPHALVSLEESLKTTTDELGNTVYAHPYETEIANLQYPKSVSTKRDPIQYLPFEGTTATFVDTYEGVLEMLEELKKAKEIAIDLEHHDARSYVGLVSLMQISTRDKDWIVDTLKPWRQKLQVLNEVFADPKIVKVFHGAFMDIVWLQRDLGLYVVGLFDTHHAARALVYPSGSLAYLLKTFVNFDADKKYQLADWRIRPLPEEMFFYARADTHFLLYIYDNVRNELIGKSNSTEPEGNLVERVIEKSKETSLLLYKRQLYDAETGKGPGGWYQFLYKATVLFNPEQFSVFKAVHQWRDQIARLDDDSTNFVMPNHILTSLARLMPTDMVALLRALHPISHNVKTRTSELLTLIKSAKEKGMNGPSMADVFHADAARINRAPRQAIRNGNAIAPVAGLTVADGEVAQSSTSTFWGDAFGSSIWDPSSKSQSSDDSGIRLAVPLPPLSSEIFATKHDSTPARRPPSPEPVVKQQPVPQPEPTEAQPFSLNKGTKRKQDALDLERMAEREEDENATDEEEKASRKAARKAAKKAEKARKKQQKAQEVGSEVSGDQEQEEEEFDYSTAQSVLHSQAQPNKPTGSKRKPFDPYAQGSEAAAKGLRRLQGEKSGKSFTFRS